MEPVTRTLTLYGKDSKASGPTKAYPHPQLVKQQGELIKDFGDISVWRFAPYPPKEQIEKFFVSFHSKSGQHSGGSTYCSKEEALAAVEKTYVSREYNAKKRELWRDYEAKLALLNEEYKGRI